MAAIEPAAQGGSGVPLAAKFFFGCALLIAVAVGAAVFVTYFRGDQVAAHAVEGALATSSAVQKEFGQGRLEQLELKVQLFAADAGTAKYIAQAGSSSNNLPGLSDRAERDTQSIADLLRERQSQYGFDLGVVLDGRGNVLGRTDQTEAFRESLADDPLVKPAIEKAAPFSGYWRQGDRVFQAAVMPLQQDQTLVGFVLLAQAVTDELCRQIARLSDAQIAYWVPAGSKLRLAASSFDEQGARALQAAVTAPSTAAAQAIAGGHSLARMPVEFGGQHWIAQLTPTAAEGEAALGAVMSLTSADRIVASYRDILDWLLIGSLLSIIVALLLSYALARGILRPVRTLAEAAEHAAAGDYKARLAVGGRDELARLSRAFDSLLSDLREKSDIEGYVGNLSRFLPDAGVEAVRAPPVAPAQPSREAARRDEVALLGLEFRQFGKSEPARTAADAMASFGTLVETVAGVAAAAGGTARPLLGPRIAVLFFGSNRITTALQAWTCLREALAAGAFEAPAAALVAGEVVFGSIGQSQPQPALLGAAMLQLDRLLPEAAPGQLLLARAGADEVKDALGADALAVAVGRATAKKFYALDEQTLGRLPRLPQPAPAAPERATLASQAARAPVATPRSASRQAALEIGSMFGGRYRILAELGSGGMGIVYKAHDLELGDVVALKMLKPGALEDSEQLERLKSEIRLARRITHPNVLRTFDFGDIEGRAYISMEYVRGLTLRYLLHETQRMPYSAGLRIARQLCAGLAAAHEVGVLHRDIKPENLILEQTGNAKLMDFGIARPIRRGAPDFTQPGTFVGTPSYSAPEQFAGENVDQRADIYSSGVLMCEMFCGKLPYSGGNTLEIYMAQLHQAPIKPSALWPEIAPALETIILRCLSRAPADRYQSANDLAQALAALRA